jgi:DNA-directed RNA polymerase subunit RPC12/RpoP
VPLFKVVVAVVVAVILIRAGLALLRALATPVPEPPPPGDLRKVKLQYRCSLCGTEVRMTVATEENPDPPRHCMEEMEIVVTEE